MLKQNAKRARPFRMKSKCKFNVKTSEVLFLINFRKSLKTCQSQLEINCSLRVCLWFSQVILWNLIWNGDGDLTLNPKMVRLSHSILITNNSKSLSLISLASDLELCFMVSDQQIHILCIRTLQTERVITNFSFLLQMHTCLLQIELKSQEIMKECVLTWSINLNLIPSSSLVILIWSLNDVIQNMICTCESTPIQEVIINGFSSQLKANLAFNRQSNLTL